MPKASLKKANEEIAKNEGQIIGEQKKQQEIIKTALENNFDVETIAKLTKVSVDEVLKIKEKIENEAKIAVTVPEYGETYELKEKVSMTNRVEGPNEKKFVRLEILERMRTLKEEIEDMEEIVKDGYLSEDRKEEDITELAERLKELENQIVKIVEKS